MRITLLAVLLVLTACAEQPGAGPAAPDPSPATTDGVAVALTGVPVVSGDGAVQWCPGPAGVEGCPGITVTGLGDDAVAAFDRNPVWRVEGVYDGATVHATGMPEPVDPAPSTEPDFTTPCEELRGRSPGVGNPDGQVQEAVQRYLETIPERHAATWWDQESSVLNVRLTGDGVDRHRAALEEAAGDRGAVCVVGGARWSAAELEQMQQRAMQIALDAGMGPWWSSPDGMHDRVDLHVERSDEETRERIRREAGEAVRVHALLALRDAPLSDLPTATARGDVELETADTRGGAGMDALGTFTIRFDEQERCVYGDMGEERIGLLWPFGYWAESDPLRVYDHDGRLIAQQGDVVQSGGGNVPREGGQVCGTTTVWAMNGPPQVVEPAEG